MKRIAAFPVAVPGLIILLTIAPCWAQGVNPTASDNEANTAGGTGALINALNTAGSGNSNTGFGDAALLFTSTGSSNTAVGSLALENNKTGSNNTACGAFALNQSTGNNNTAVGTSALTNNSSGIGNTASGFNALQLNTDGNNNTAIGFKALKKSTGTKNIGIGSQAGVTLGVGSNNIYIGNQGDGDESQTIRIGTAQTRTFMAGLTALVNGAPLEVDTNTGQLGISIVSSARFKRDIEPMGSRSSAVFQLQPVTYAYREDASGVVRYGLIAEEVQAVYPELVTHTAAGELLAVRYQELIPMLLNELQRQQQTIQRESAELTALRNELAELRALIATRPGTAASAESPMSMR